MHIAIDTYHILWIYIKTHGSELRGQEAASAHPSRPHGLYSENN